MSKTWIFNYIRFLKKSQRHQLLITKLLELLNCLASCYLSRYRSSHRRCSMKKGVLVNFPTKFTGNHLCQSLFFNKVDLQLYYKRDSGIRAFLWILQNFQEHFFYRTPLDGCFQCFCKRKLLSLNVDIDKCLKDIVWNLFLEAAFCRCSCRCS